MPYCVLFDSDLPELATRELVRVLESFPLSVVAAGEATAERDTSSRCADVPIITLATCPTRLVSLRAVGPRGWIAILPAEEGCAARFFAAGAFDVLRMPVERGKLLSVVSRCLSVGGARAAEGSWALDLSMPATQDHAGAG